MLDWVSLMRTYHASAQCQHVEPRGASIHTWHHSAEGSKDTGASERLIEMKSRVESMVALRERGIDALFSLLDSLLPPLVASGALLEFPAQHDSVHPPAQYAFWGSYCISSGRP